MNTYHAYISKNNLNHGKQVILLMIPNGKGCCKKLSAILTGITSKRDGDFCCLIAFIRLEQKTNLNCIKKYLKIKIFVVFALYSLLKTLKY